MKYRIDPSLYLEMKDSQHLTLNNQWFSDLSISFDEKGIIGTAVYLKTQEYLFEPFALDEFTELLSKNLPDCLQELRETVECAVSHGFIKEYFHGEN